VGGEIAQGGGAETVVPLRQLPALESRHGARNSQVFIPNMNITGTKTAGK
jgi:hypothetical protein